MRKLSFLDFLWDVATGNSLDGFQWHHPDHSTFSKNNAIFLGPFCRHLPRHVYYCISGANMKSTPRFVGCVCETESRRDREREKKCSEMIVPLSVVQECGLKGTKHSVVADSHVLIGSVTFGKGMLGSLCSGVCHRLWETRLLRCNSSNHWRLQDLESRHWWRMEIGYQFFDYALCIMSAEPDLLSL